MCPSNRKKEMMNLDLIVHVGTKQDFDPNKWGFQYFLFKEDPLDLIEIKSSYKHAYDVTLPNSFLKQVEKKFNSLKEGQMLEIIHEID